MTDLLLDPAWYLPLALLVIGITVFWTGNRRLDKTLKSLGLLLAAASLAWAATAYLLQTPREKAIAHTKSILTAYEKHDWPKLESLLDPATTLARYGNRSMIMDGAKSSIDNPGVRDLYILSTSASQIQSHIEVTTTVVTTVDRAMGRPIRSTWQFDYVNMGGAWTLTTITPLALENQSAEPILRQLPQVPR